MSFLNKFWSTNKQTTTQTSTTKIKDTYIDIIISLTKDKQIDFSVFIDDKIEKTNMLSHSVLYGEFLNLVLTNSLKHDTIDILNKQIKNNDNQELVSNIVSILKTSPKKSEKISTNKTFIKPSEVFARYNNI